MVVIFEVGPPFQIKAGKFENVLMTRYWWGWFAISFLKVTLPEFSERADGWTE